MKIPYKTSDLALAAYLALQGYNFELADDDVKYGKKVFCFERKTGKKIEDEVAAYQRRETRVDPRQYFDSISNLKARIYERN
jgi:hypothetical protein